MNNNYRLLNPSNNRNDINSMLKNDFKKMTSLDLQNKNRDTQDYFNINNKNWFDYNKEEELAIIRTIKKNSWNNKILNKRSVGGSWSFRENYADINSKKSLSTINSKHFANQKPGKLPKLKVTKDCK
jgi:hypothetical protein